MSDPILNQKIAEWRLRLAEGTLSQAEMIEVVKTLRAGRLRAAEASASASKKKRKAIAEIPSADDMLSEMMGPTSAE